MQDALDDAALLHYARHILLEEIDVSGQLAFLRAKVLVIGLGGLGCPASLYLASSGVGNLWVVDEDVVEESNLQRQVLYTIHDLGKPKALVAAQRLVDLNPRVNIVPLATRATASSLHQWLVGSEQPVDVVLDCTDNFATRDMINRACVAAKVPLVSGAAIGWLAQCAVYDSRQTNAPCYHCVFPEGEAVDDTRCATTGVFAPLVGMVGTQQAALALRLLLNTMPELTPALLRMDFRTGLWQRVGISRDHACPVCSTLR